MYCWGGVWINRRALCSEVPVKVSGMPQGYMVEPGDKAEPVTSLGRREIQSSAALQSLPPSLKLAYRDNP